MTLDLDAIQKRCDAATPGEWVWNGGGVVIVVPVPTKRQPHRTTTWDVIGAYLSSDPDDEGAEVWIADADRDFILASRTDIPALIAEVRRLRSLLCRHCACRADHSQPCHCENDE